MKYFLRLIVAGIALAVIVVVLMNTVFKTESSIETYKTIANELSPNGEITKLSDVLNDEDVETEHKIYVELLTNEENTLISLYPLILETKANSDKKTTIMLDALKNFKNCLKDVNKDKTNIITSQANTEIRKQMIKDMAKHLVLATTSLVELNVAMCKYLIEYYYNNNLDANISLKYIQSIYAQLYLQTSAQSNPNEATKALIKQYKANYDNLSKIFKAEHSQKVLNEISKENSFNEFLYNARKVSLYKSITDESYYTSIENQTAQDVNDYITKVLLGNNYIDDLVENSK